MVVGPILPYAEFGPNDYRVDAPHFTNVHGILLPWQMLKNACKSIDQNVR